MCYCSVQKSERYVWVCHYNGSRGGFPISRGNVINDDEEFALVAQVEYRFGANNV